MCGIVGIVGTTPVNQRLYDALTVLQHRGQDAAGIMTAFEGRLCSRKGAGLVRDVFEQLAAGHEPEISKQEAAALLKKVIETLGSSPAPQ